ncbi:hypothetical protein GO283_00584 [Ralstonia solanacearum]|nr:hypothetical protein [Ralstonia solanacearum]
MKAAQIVSKAVSLGVSLRLDGDMVRIRGPKHARDAILADVAAHKPEIVVYLRCTSSEALHMPGYPVAEYGGPFTPWCAPMSPNRVAGLLADLRATIGRLADIEGWADERRVHLLGMVARQPVSTLADDLAYFRERLSAVEVVERINSARSSGLTRTKAHS